MAELCETRGQAQVDMYPESDDSGKIVQEPQDTEDSLIFGLLAEAAEQQGPPIPACGATFPGLDCHGQGETSGGVDSRKLEDGMDEKDKATRGRARVLETIQEHRLHVRGLSVCPYVAP